MTKYYLQISNPLKWAWLPSILLLSKTVPASRVKWNCVKVAMDFENELCESWHRRSYMFEAEELDIYLSFFRDRVSERDISSRGFFHPIFLRKCKSVCRKLNSYPWLITLKNDFKQSSHCYWSLNRLTLCGKDSFCFLTFLAPIQHLRKPLTVSNQLHLECTAVCVANF